MINPTPHIYPMNQCVVCRRTRDMAQLTQHSFPAILQHSSYYSEVYSYKMTFCVPCFDVMAVYHCLPQTFYDCVSFNCDHITCDLLASSVLIRDVRPKIVRQVMHADRLLRVLMLRDDFRITKDSARLIMHHLTGLHPQIIEDVLSGRFVPQVQLSPVGGCRCTTALCPHKPRSHAEKIWFRLEHGRPYVCLHNK